MRCIALLCDGQDACVTCRQEFLDSVTSIGHSHVRIEFLQSNMSNDHRPHWNRIVGNGAPRRDGFYDAACQAGDLTGFGRCSCPCWVKILECVPSLNMVAGRLSRRSGFGFRIEAFGSR